MMPGQGRSINRRMGDPTKLQGELISRLIDRLLLDEKTLLHSTSGNAEMGEILAITDSGPPGYIGT